VQKTKDFSKFVVYPHDKGRLSQCGNFSGKFSTSKVSAGRSPASPPPVFLYMILIKEREA